MFGLDILYVALQQIAQEFITKAQLKEGCGLFGNYMSIVCAQVRRNPETKAVRECCSWKVRSQKMERQIIKKEINSWFINAFLFNRSQANITKDNAVK